MWADQTGPRGFVRSTRQRCDLNIGSAALPGQDTCHYCHGIDESAIIVVFVVLIVFRLERTALIATLYGHLSVTFVLLLFRCS